LNRESGSEANQTEFSGANLLRLENHLSNINGLAQKLMGCRYIIPQ
jgi:hypothetical protein